MSTSNICLPLLDIPVILNHNSFFGEKLLYALSCQNLSRCSGTVLPSVISPHHHRAIRSIPTTK